ncbi:MAG: hypothetical protein J0I06_14215, partial [Planctomycetes bacterium]|nr:hypothetical protein [Planctomycetota bacterium]
FISSHRAKKPQPPPEILIELYLKQDKVLADLQGTINSLMLDQPGISLAIRLNDNFKEEYREYVADSDALNSIPVEYYEIVWQSFAAHPLEPRAVRQRPLKYRVYDLETGGGNGPAGVRRDPRQEPVVPPGVVHQRHKCS